ncbi:MAG: protein kinase [Terracidiphilus sp.]
MRNKGDADPCPDCGWQEGTEPDSPVQLAPRTILVGKYLIGRVLGQGGFGITYLAWDLLLGRKLAIKEYFPREICSRGRDTLTVQALSQRSRQDFQYGLSKFTEEGQNLARFRDYPGIVSLLEFFESNGTAYIVMAYMEGMTLKQYLEEQGGKLDFEATLAILTPVMDALREVHSVGMLHRDISPDNIYLNQDRQVKILDFGATRYAMREQSHGLTVLFKPGYAPFEQYSSGGKQGPWTDVYAVGATFYRALTGKAPSEAPDRMAHDDLILPSAMGIKIPTKSEPALLKALAVHWESRFHQVKDFQEAITPPKLGPAPALEHSNRAWMVAVCVLFATTLAFAGMWYSANSSNQRLRSANRALIESEKTPSVTFPADGTQQSQAELNQTKAKLVDATQESQSAKDKLSESARNLAAVTAERNTLQARAQELTGNLATAQQQINDLQREVELSKHRQPANPGAPPSLSIAYLQLFEWDRLTNTRKGPTNQFPAATSRRILCAIGGPNPTQGSQPFSGQVAIAFIGPNGATKIKVPLPVRTNTSQATWAAMAYWGNDKMGTLEKGTWRIDVSSGSQMLKSSTFTVY